MPLGEDVNLEDVAAKSEGMSPAVTPLLLHACLLRCLLRSFPRPPARPPARPRSSPVPLCVLVGSAQLLCVCVYARVACGGRADTCAHLAKQHRSLRQYATKPLSLPPAPVARRCVCAHSRAPLQLQEGCAVLWQAQVCEDSHFA